jgi:hypothetical protein
MAASSRATLARARSSDSCDRASLSADRGQRLRAAVDRLLAPLEEVGHHLAKVPAAIVQGDLAGNEERLLLVEACL